MIGSSRKLLSVDPSLSIVNNSVASTMLCIRYTNTYVERLIPM